MELAVLGSRTISQFTDSIIFSEFAREMKLDVLRSSTISPFADSAGRKHLVESARRSDDDKVTNFLSG